MTNLKRNNILSDPEFWMILFFNCLFIFLYLTKNISVGDVVWIYFFQSVLLGFQYLIRMVWISRRSEEQGKWFTPLFFCGHFGLFHLVYFIFLIAMTAGSDGIGANFRTILTGFGIMLINTLFSTISDVKSDKISGQNSPLLMFIPYLRIAPIHLFIIIGFGSMGKGSSINNNWIFRQDAFMIFIILKTITDLLFHIIINKTWKEKRTKAIGELF